MSIKFNNKQIDIKNDCVITNYDTRKKKHAQAKDFTLILNGDNLSIKKGNDVPRARGVIAGKDISSAQNSVFMAICSADGNAADLTEQDLKKAKQLFQNGDKRFNNLKTNGFGYDEYAGVAQLAFKNGEVLRIDLATKVEKAEADSKSKKTKSEQKEKSEQNNKTVSKTVSAKNTVTEPVTAKPKSVKGNVSKSTEATPSVKHFNLPKGEGALRLDWEIPIVKDILDKFYKENLNYHPVSTNKKCAKAKSNDTRYSIPAETIDNETGNKYIQKANNPRQFSNLKPEDTPYIKQIAKRTGMSEYFIRYLASTEKYTPVAVNIGDNQVTIGFGHTTKAKHNTNFKKGDTITRAKAFKWLEQDIIDSLDYARECFTPKSGQYKDKFKYDDLPQSIKETLIDIAFNRGIKVMASDSIYASLRANFRDGADNMPAAAVRTRQETFPDPQPRRDKNGKIMYDKNGKMLMIDFEPGLRKRNVYRFLLAIRSLSGEYKLAAMRRFDRDEFDKQGKRIQSYYAKTLQMLEKNLPAEAAQLKKDWTDARRAAEYEAQQGR